jgi:hypothetical protein
MTMQGQKTSLTQLSNILYDSTYKLLIVIQILVFCNITSYVSFAVYKTF